MTCDMEFSKMPFDTQSCAIRLGAWVGNELTTPIVFISNRINDRIKLSELAYGGTAEWRIVGFSSNYTKGRQADGLPPLTALNAPAVNHGARLEPILSYNIHIERSSRYWVESVILPAMLLVSMSYATVFIQRTAMPARAAFASICFLTLATRDNAVLATIPFSEKSNSAASRILTDTAAGNTDIPLIRLVAEVASHPVLARGWITLLVVCGSTGLSTSL